MATNPVLQQAMTAIRQQQFARAAGLLAELLKSQPGDVQARWLLIQSLEGQGQSDDALDQLRQLLIYVKNDLPAIDRIAAHMRQRHYSREPVIKAYKRFLESHPKSAPAAFNLAWNFTRDGQFDAAISLYERSLGLGIDTPEEVHLNIANIYMDHLHAHDEARAHLAKALELNPEYASAFYNLGNMAEQEGDREKASRNFQHCLKIEPTHEAALARLADTQKFTTEVDPLLQQLVRTAAKSEDPDVHMALGKAYEQLGRFASAWQNFSTGNMLDKRMSPAYSPDRAEAHFSHVMTQCDQAWLDQYQGESHEPVFICGMFRSGSTLLEQMLAAHPGFTAGGESEFFPRLMARELPDYPRGLGELSADQLLGWRRQHKEQLEKRFKESSRTTDKRPDNFLIIGLIKAVLPSAKFIVTERNWRDIATSVYSVRLGPSQSYARNLQDIQHYIGLQERLVNHWAELLGADLRRVRYEDLILEPRQTMTELLHWLGEDWNEDCLSFHELRNSVKTASVWQVREPLHAKSIGRWKHYEQQFIEALGPEVNA